MRCLASSATAMSTPASAYFIKGLVASFSIFASGANSHAKYKTGNLGRAQRGLAPARKYHDFTNPLKGPEDALPPHDAGMQDGVRVGEETLAKLTWFPGFRRNIERHVNHDWRADDVLARDAAPEPAVVGVAAIVAHHEVAVGGNGVGHVHFVGLAAAVRVFFAQFLAVDPHGA